MISLDLMKSSEVRKAGDRSNYQMSKCPIFKVCLSTAIIHDTTLDILFCQITTFIKVCVPLFWDPYPSFDIFF